MRSNLGMTDVTKWWTYGRDDGRSPVAPRPFFTFGKDASGGLVLEGAGGGLGAPLPQLLGPPIQFLGEATPQQKVSRAFFIGAALTAALCVGGAAIGAALGKSTNRSGAWGLVGALAGSAAGTLGTFGAVAASAA